MNGARAASTSGKQPARCWNLLTRQQNGEVAGFSSQISAKAKEPKAELKKHIQNLSANEYLAAKRFLDQLI